MCRRTVFLSLALTLYFASDLSAQLNVSATAEAATCSANGRIRVQVTGGSGSYTYQLTGPCAENIPPQPDALFDFLTPCLYTVRVIDRQTNATGMAQVEVGGTYVEMTLSVVSEGCNQRLVVTGGRPPYRFSYSPNGIAGPYQPNSPADSPVFAGVGGSDIHLSVEDACGIRRAIRTEPLINPVRAIKFPETNDEGISVEVVGGNQPYTYRLLSETDTFLLDQPFIPWDSMRCNARLEVRDACSAFVQAVPYEPGAVTLCVNFSAGTAEVAPTRGVAPFTFKILAPDTQFISTTGLFDSLPINAGYYEFVVIDACGKEITFDDQTPLRINVADTDLGCTDDVLRFNVVRRCGGALFGPVLVTCLNCSPLDTVIVNSFEQDVELSGFQAGDWEIKVENACGDQTVCRDELIVELTPACDSIVARIVDLFSCDNGAIGRRVITGDDAKFFLLDESGAPVFTNGSPPPPGLPPGVWTNLSEGTYQVIAVLPNCDTLRATTTIAPPEPIDPFLETWAYYRENNGVCRLVYNVKIGKAEGPYVLAGGPNGNYYQVLNNFKEDSCPTYSVWLSPGVYTLKSMSFCSSRTIELPQPEYDFSVKLVDNCPGDAKLLATGIRNQGEWQAYYEPFDLNVQNLYPGYFRNQLGENSRREDGFSFRGLSPGKHTVYLYDLEERGCPIDTIEVEVPEYDPVRIELEGDVVCDNNNTSDVDIRIEGGQGPYTLRKLDCESAETLSSFTVAKGGGFVDENLPLGGYCYAVSDVCQISADFQVKVRLFADSIRFGYTCDGMLHLAVDSLPVSYTWRNSQGQVLGDRFAVSVPAPQRSETFTVQVGLSECVVERRITISPREIVPKVEIMYDGLSPVLCGAEPRRLTAVTMQGNEVLWNTGETTGVILAREPDTYVVVSTNDLGCIDSDTLTLPRITPPAPQILGIPGFCLGESTELSLDQSYVGSEWSTGAQVDEIEVSVPGPITVAVSDEHGCVGRDSVEVEEWPLPQPEITGDTLICPNATAPLSLTQVYAAYQWSDGSDTPGVDFPAGSHAVTVTDEHGCRGQDNIVITEKPQLYARLSGDTTICARDSALLTLSFTRPWYDTEVRIVGSGGEDVRLQISGDTTFWLPVNNTTTLSLASIVMEAYGCPVIAQRSATVNANRVNLVLRPVPISCPGGSDGALEVFAVSNFPPYDFSWNNGGNTARITNLSEGIYSVHITDQLGCQARDSLSLEAPSPIAPNWNFISPLCRDINDGLISLDGVRGGTPPFVWRMNNVEQGRAPGEVTGLSAGTYQLSLRDQNNCPWDSTVVFPMPPVFSLDIGEDQTIVIGEMVRLDPVTNVASVTDWTWQVSPPLELAPTLEQEVQPFEKTDFILTVRNAYGCVLTDKISVYVNKDSQFDAPNAFSPDGDGLNDYFVLYGKPSNIESIELFEVYDRWGNRVFGTNAMELNNELSGWDGRLGGHLLNAGVYVWMARVRRIDGEQVMVYGDVALIR